MRYCTNCGATIGDDAAFCVGCGTKIGRAMATAVGATTVVSRQPQNPIWHVTYATGQTGGPFTEDEVIAMIARQEIKVTDSVIAHGGSSWLPITQSPFARYIVTQAATSRLASSTCPQCGGSMVVVRKVPAMAFAFIAVGIFTSLALIGIPFLIMGWTMRRNAKLRYQCPRCNYRSN